MVLLFMSDSDDPKVWAEALRAFEPDLEVRVWPDVGVAEEIEFALVWLPPPGMLAGLPGLKLIQSLGAGIDHIFSDPDLPRDVPVARLVDDELTRQMVEYVTLAVLSRHRRIDRYRHLQAERQWRPSRSVPLSASRVGVLGLGVIGAATATALAGLGLAVAGWSRAPKQIDRVENFAGAGGLDAFLARSDILVCLLPLTPETEGVLNARTLGALPEGAYVINVGRGGHVVEADLIAAIDGGHLSGAWLDVFRSEPLPSDHPFWSHPSVTVTPHVAALTEPASAAAQVIENIRRARQGREPLHRVDLAAGY